jgi:hypothetical protein
MEKHLILDGAGNVHRAAFRNLEQFTQKGPTVTVISPSSY